MGASMGQTLVIDNRGGASGTIGQQAVATAALDGYTIMIHSSSHTVSPSTFAKLSSTRRRLRRRTPISTLPNALVIFRPRTSTLKELVAAASTARTINFASAAGQRYPFNAEKFKLAADRDATNIPFKGSADAVTEVLSGRVDYYFSPIARSSVRSRKAICLHWPWAAAAPLHCPTCLRPPRPACPAPNSTSIGMMAPAKSRVTSSIAARRGREGTRQPRSQGTLPERRMHDVKPEQFDA